MGITSILDRNQEPVDFGHTYKPLVQYPVDSYPAEQVPDWLNEIPITKPGRSGKNEKIFKFIINCYFSSYISADDQSKKDLPQDLILAKA